MSDVTDDSTSREYFYSLEILRGLCAFMVFVYGVLSFLTPEYAAALHIIPLVRELNALSFDAITIFFVLSGFVVAHSYQTYRETWGPVIATPVYLCARAIRIWSLSIPVALATYLAVTCYRAIHGPAEFLYFNNIDALWPSLFGYHNEWNPAGWTLVYGLWAYFTLPFIALTLFARNVVLKILGEVIGAAIFSFHWVKYGGNWPLLVEFTAGVALYMAYRRYKIAPVSRNHLIAFVVFFLVSGWVLAGIHAFWMVDLQFARAANAIGLLMVFLSAEPYVRASAQTRITRTFLTLGQYSYSLYLWHFAVLEISLMYLVNKPRIENAHDLTLYLVVSVPLILPVTWASYQLFEKHARMSRILRMLKKHQPAS